MKTLHNENAATTKIIAFLMGIVLCWAASYVVMWMPDELVASFANDVIALSPPNKNSLATIFFYFIQFVSTLFIVSLSLLVMAWFFRSSLSVIGVPFFSGYLFGSALIFCVALFLLPFDIAGIALFGGQVLSSLAGVIVVWSFLKWRNHRNAT